MRTKRNLTQRWLLCAAMLHAVTSGAQPVTKVAAGFPHSLFLKSDGSLWGMGGNAVGELGDSTYSNYVNRPEQIVSSNVTAVAAGWCHTLLLQSDGSLWAMGGNVYGQLGDGTTNTWPNPSPEQIVASNVTAIAAGYFHSLFLKNDGSLWGMGWNALGGLGDGTFEPIINRPEQIVASNVTAMAAGWNHSLFIKRDGSLWAMGYGGNGELGDGAYNQTNRPELIVTSNVMAVAAGGYYSLFLKDNGSLWTMGASLEPPFNTNTNRPRQIVAGGVTAMGRGYAHYLFVKSDGSLWGLGDNGQGQLGDGTNTDPSRLEQILAPYNQVLGQLLSGGDVLLSFEGIAGANYALERTFTLAPANWLPQATNPANSFGALVFTNTPNPATNNFWRIRSVP
jgi:alpha-tubulin suppressor-like RCC1 family protein